MNATTIARIKRDVQAARDRGDLVQVARLRFQLPLSERQDVITAARYGGYQPIGMRYDGQAPASTTTSARSTAGYSPAIIIDESAWRQLDGDHFDGRERGGYLFGPADQPDAITMAVLADEDDGDSHNVRLDRARAHEIWESLPLDMTIRGAWHCHPRGTHAEPSPTDLRSAQAAAEAYKRPWIELVIHDAPTTAIGLNGRPRSSSSLEISATVVRSDGSRIRTQVERR